jgi:hypothetical protein
MALLDLQGLELTAADRNRSDTGGSRASLLLCGDSSLSVVTCS